VRGPVLRRAWRGFAAIFAGVTMGSPPAASLEREAVAGVGIATPNDQDPGMHVLMTRAVEQDAIGGRPRAATTAELQVMHVRTLAALTGATPTPLPRQTAARTTCRVMARAPRRSRRMTTCGLGLRHVGITGHRVDAAIVRSAHTRTPGICVAPLSARTTPPSAV
jgi:hypothetical protein